MPPTAAQDPRNNPASRAVLTGLIGPGGGRRAFVDATGAPVVPPPVIRRVVATDDRVGALLLDIGAPMIGCAGAVGGVETVGVPREPEPQAIAALRPDLIITGTVDGTHDLADQRLVAALRQVAPVVAVDVDRREAATADLRALLGPAVGGGKPAAVPMSERRVGAP